MLTAKGIDGRLYTLPEKVSTDLLPTIKAAQPFYCPCCNSEVVVKAGFIKIPHFAHKSHASCNASSEPESDYHLLAKRNLFKWFRSHGYQAELEGYIPNIKKRADILVRSGEKQYAIEFQCSTISEAIFIERTVAYQSVGIIPIWILAAKNVKRVEAHEFKISAFQWLFVTGSRDYPYLWTYCPVENSFSALKGITPFSPSIAFAEMTTAPLKRLSPEHLIPRENESFSVIALWRYKRKSWCLHRVKAANLHDPLFRALYANRLTTSTLPIVVGLPVKGMSLIKTAAIEWQTWLYLDVLHKRELGQIVLLRAFYQSFQKRCASGFVKLRPLPLLLKEETVHPVQEYVHLLTKMCFLTKKTEGSYQVTKEISVPRNMVENEKLEHTFYREYKVMLEKERKNRV